MKRVFKILMGLMGLVAVTLTVSCSSSSEPPYYDFEKNASFTSPEQCHKMVNDLSENGVQVIQEARQTTLILPTDKFYLPDSYELNDLEYDTLNNVAKLVQLSSSGVVYVAGFTDDGIPSRKDRTSFSQEKALTMANFLWAHGVPLHRLAAIGYGHRFDIGNNALIHGSALNRRVEIQWEDQCCFP